MDRRQKGAAIALGVLTTVFAGYVGGAYLHRPGGLGLTSGHIHVSVEGGVAKPGEYDLPAGATVGDILQASGGASREADVSALNLEQPLQDKAVVHVAMIDDGGDSSRVVGPTSGGSGAGGRVSGGGGKTPKKEPPPLGSVSLNSATSDELQQIKGIGPAMAQRIVDYRNQHGGFKSVQELDNVKGIGPKTLAKLSPYFRL